MENIVASQVLFILSTYNDMGATAQDLMEKAAYLCAFPDALEQDFAWCKEAISE